MSCTGCNYSEIIEENIIKESDIIIKFIENNWLYMKIPFLLPKKEKGSASYIRATVQTAFKNYIKHNGNINKTTKESIIIFQHIYDKALPQTAFRDHDNIELNVVVDSIALYVLTDDSPMLLKHYYTTNVGDSSYTNIFVIPVDDFTYWLSSYENNLLLGQNN